MVFVKMSKVWIPLFVAFICVLHISARWEDKPVNPSISILTIGNSFADNACTFLPQIAESVPGYNINITKANIGGCSLEKHANLIGKCQENPNLNPYFDKYCLEDLLTMQDYDFVTIQQVSSLSFKSESYEPYAQKLINFISKHAPGAETVIHQTWAYGPGSKRLENWDMTREDMQKGLSENYSNLASKYNLDILPSGSAFFRSFEKNSGIDLWNNDRYHANMYGCYLAGCVWFGKMSGESPRKIRFVPEGMESEDAKFLRKVAAKVLKGNRR